ncbi:hypothetical protein P691DRAFT_780052 [Macrolepiota fuliginosa MF-IS2]|uniref:Helicase C-terminal domain-containing protein n=1 Tax=Macrolepiota fuliginosa MF-IS2 TaxID=1400762 RepID=A0A9P6BWI4_9AGAR|nr:hypothetical protein P691DRAFT_780052 [Macrolepiota fuliginosa MF-IS2]
MYYPIALCDDGYDGHVKLKKIKKNWKPNDLLNPEFNRVVIFVNIHSGLSREERIKRYTIFEAFGKRILVATGIFGREIDVEHVNIVVNCDRPPDLDSYLNHVGHADRFGAKCLATDLDVILLSYIKFAWATPSPLHFTMAEFGIPYTQL